LRRRPVPPRNADRPEAKCESQSPISSPIPSSGRRGGDARRVRPRGARCFSGAHLTIDRLYHRTARRTRRFRRGFGARASSRIPGMGGSQASLRAIAGHVLASRNAQRPWHRPGRSRRARRPSNRRRAVRRHRLDASSRCQRDRSGQPEHRHHRAGSRAKAGHSISGEPPLTRSKAAPSTASLPTVSARRSRSPKESAAWSSISGAATDQRAPSVIRCLQSPRRIASSTRSRRLAPQWSGRS